MIKRSDIFVSLLIGIIISFFLLVIINTLKDEFSITPAILNFRWFLLLLIPLCVLIYVYVISIAGGKWPLVFQFGKFLIIGSSNFSIDFGILNLFINLTDIDSGISYSVFKATSFILASVNSYIWNKYWTFGDSEGKGMVKQFMKFFLVAVGGFLINVTIATLVVNVFEPPFEFISGRIWANIGALTSLVFTLAWNFTGYKIFVFKK